MTRFTIAALIASSATAAHAQVPQACDQQTHTADYGPVRVGTVVVAQRHRFVLGDPNWDPRMGRFLGRSARVVRLSGVDARGCPGVRLDIDAGRFFWRVRDLGVRAARPRTTDRPAGGRIPQLCGLTDETAEYGSIRLGSIVVLGRHRPVRGDDNWSPLMHSYVGRTARVVELGGADDRGCPVVLVDADARQWSWRIRDLQFAARDAGEIAYRPTMASDHGRSTELPAAALGDPSIPQACGANDATANYGPVRVGREVILGRHRTVDGEPNWVEQMESYVGRRATVTELIGVDDQGCALLRVDVDGGDWFWRLRDVRIP